MEQVTAWLRARLSERGRLALSAGLTAGAVLACAAFVLSGQVHLVRTQGQSMQPSISEGDLVVVVKRAQYQKGMVVAYESPELGRVVLHRVQAIDEQGVVTKGDNNPWIDPETPTSSALLGEMRVHLPGPGRVRERFGEPGYLTLAAIGVMLLLAPESAPRSRRRRSEVVEVDLLLPELAPAESVEPRHSEDLWAVPR